MSYQRYYTFDITPRDTGNVSVEKFNGKKLANSVNEKIVVSPLSVSPLSVSSLSSAVGDVVSPLSNSVNSTSPRITANLPPASNKPEVWGPLNWYTYHNGAANLPKVLSPVSAERLGNFVDGIPEMVPCDKCSEHARYFVESNKTRIQNFKTRDDVFTFYVDFHNYVNERLGKPKMSVENAKKLYGVKD